MNPVRRLGAAVGGMRWGQVILELALLIAGILIALAVDGWMDDRRDMRTERNYLELLVRDLDRDLDMLAEYTAFEERQVEDGIRAYRALRAGASPEEREAVAASLSNLMSRRTLRITRPTYTDLISTGNLRLIRNARLRDSVTDLYERNERLLAIRDRNNLVFVDQQFLQFIMDNGLIAPRTSSNMPSSAKSNLKFARRIEVPVGVDNDRLWELGPASPEWITLTNKVWQRAEVTQAALDQTEVMANEIRGLRQAIADELARRWPDDRRG